MSEMPGPAVEVKARAPLHEAPITIPMAANSSSACRMMQLFLPVSGSRRYLSQNSLKASITEVEGVIGYQAATVAPAYTQPKAAAVLPSIRILSEFASIFSRQNGRGHSKCF